MYFERLARLLCWLFFFLFYPLFFLNINIHTFFKGLNWKVAVHQLTVSMRNINPGLFLLWICLMRLQFKSSVVKILHPVKEKFIPWENCCPQMEPQTFTDCQFNL